MFIKILRGGTFLLLFLLVLVNCAQRAELKPKSNELTREGIARLEAGREEEAGQFFEQALQINAGDAGAWLGMGMLKARRGEYDQALKSFSQALRLEPKNAPAYYHQAVVFKALGKTESARKSLEKSIELAKTRQDQALFLKAGLELGQVLAIQDKYQESMNCFARLLKLYPANPELWHARGLALEIMGKPEEAIQAYQKAVAIKPDFFDAWYDMATVVRDLQRYPEAIRCYEQSLALAPEYPSLWFNKGLCLEQLGRDEEALACYQKMLALKKRIFAKGEKGRAVKNRIEELSPIASDELVNYYESLLAQKPDDVSINLLYGMYLVDIGRYEEALQCLDKVIAGNPESLLAWYTRGLIREDFGDYVRALGDFEKIVTLKKERFSQALVREGVTLKAGKKFAPAIASLNKAILIKPDLAAAWFEKALVLKALGRSEEADSGFKQANLLAKQQNDQQLLLRLKALDRD